MISFKMKGFSVATLLALLLSACQTTPYQTQSFSYSHYYLWLKTLSKNELAIEASTLTKENKTKSDNNSQMKLLIIHSLPNSPIYKPYRAKSLLNQYPLPATIEAENYSAVSNNLAFMILLKEQLNAQLLLIEKYEQINKNNQLQLTKQAALIEQLQTQLNQLKKIERNINEH